MRFSMVQNLSGLCGTGIIFAYLEAPNSISLRIPKIDWIVLHFLHFPCSPRLCPCAGVIPHVGQWLLGVRAFGTDQWPPSRAFPTATRRKKSQELNESANMAGLSQLFHGRFF